MGKDDHPLGADLKAGALATMSSWSLIFWYNFCLASLALGLKLFFLALADISGSGGWWWWLVKVGWNKRVDWSCGPMIFYPSLIAAQAVWQSGPGETSALQPDGPAYRVIPRKPGLPLPVSPTNILANMEESTREQEIRSPKIRCHC